MFNKISSSLKEIPAHWTVSISAWISRAVSAFIQIISIRTLLQYLGEERYAVYVISYSLSAWFALCELGVGTSLQNYISECRAKNKSYDKYLLAALQVTSVLMIIFILVLLLLSSTIQEYLFRKYMNLAELHSVNIIAIIGCVFLVSTFANIVYKVYFALHKGYLASVLPAVSLIFSMIFIVLINRYCSVRESITIALLTFAVPNLLVALIPFIKIFKGFFMKIFAFDSAATKELVIRAVKFGGYSVMATATMQIDYMIMSQFVDPNEITTYNIFNKFFTLTLFVHAAALQAFWPVSNEMFHKGEYARIKKMLAGYLVFGGAVIIAATAFISFFSGTIIEVLAPGLVIRPTLILFALFGSYYLIRIWNDTFTTFLQSINVIKIFWLYIPFQMIISVSAQYFLSSRYGIYGILAGLMLSFVLTSCWVLFYKTISVFKSKETENAV